MHEGTAYLASALPMTLLACLANLSLLVLLINDNDVHLCRFRKQLRQVSMPSTPLQLLTIS